VTVYVDDLVHWGWRLRGHEVASCHMFCDAVDLEELHAFAERIGLKRAWFQPHRLAPHYDLTPSRRADAIAHGAVAVDRYAAVEIWRGRRATLAAKERMES
jgi:hypothetical protein